MCDRSFLVKVPLTLLRPEPDDISPEGTVKARMWYWKTRSSPGVLNIGEPILGWHGPPYRFRLVVSQVSLNWARKHLVNSFLVRIREPCPWVPLSSASLQSWSAAMENIDPSRTPSSSNFLNNIVLSGGSRITKKKEKKGISYLTILSRSVVRSMVSWTMPGLHPSSTAIR